MDGQNKAVPKRRLHLRVSQKTYDTVSAIATARETTKAEILRELLNDGVRYQQSKAGQPA